MLEFEALRRRMVDHQLRPSDVTDHEVIRAFMEVPREQFVEPAEQPFAYADRELRMLASGTNRRVMAPAQLARLLQALPHDPDTKAMVVGCGTGYSAALLARLVNTVVAVEEDRTLHEIARQRLDAVAAANVSVVQARLIEGHAAEAPYDSILIDGAVEVVPAALIRQLGPDGLLATIVRGEGTGRGTLFKRLDGEETQWPLFDAWAELLPGFESAREFVF